MKAVWIVTLLILTTVTACGTPASASDTNRPANQGSGPIPDSVTIVESNPLHQKIQRIDETITHPGTVSRIYQDLTHLPKVNATGSRSCPEDFGVTYKLTFQRNGTTVDTAVVDPSGCRMVSFNGIPKEGESKEGARFFTDLSVVLEVPEITLMGNPSAPMALPLQTNPAEIIITKNQNTKTITNQVAIASLVQLFNQAFRTTPGGVSCMAMTKDVYRITFAYDDGEDRVFENNGGACQPMIDMYTGFKFPSASVISSKDLQ